MKTTPSLSKFQTLMAVYEICYATAFSDALQISPIAVKILSLICDLPGMTLTELGCVLGNTRGQVISAVFDLRDSGYVELSSGPEDESFRTVKPVAERVFGFRGYQALVDKLGSEAGISEQLEALLPTYHDVLAKALSKLQDDLPDRQRQARQRVLTRLRHLNSGGLMIKPPRP